MAVGVDVARARHDAQDGHSLDGRSFIGHFPRECGAPPRRRGRSTMLRNTSAHQRRAEQYRQARLRARSRSACGCERLSPRATSSTAMAAITIERERHPAASPAGTAASATGAGLGTGSGHGHGFPLAAAKWDYQGHATRRSQEADMTIAAILRDKGSEVATIGADATVARCGRPARRAADRRLAGGRRRAASPASCPSATSSTACATMAPRCSTGRSAGR